MKRETIAWFPCVLLCQKMNIADPSKCKDDARKSGPFSLLAHVNPFAGTKQRDKEFEKPIQCEDEVVPNAYVPKDTPKVVLPKSIPTRSESSVAMESSPSSLQEDSSSKTITKPSSTFKPTPIVPKTELELSIQQRATTHPSEKKDIYKAIFESSDEEAEDEETQEPAITPPPAPFIPSRLAEDVNILRNTSPPRGIFAGLSNNKATRKSPSPQPKDDDGQVAAAEPDSIDNLYGPSLPLTTRPLAASASAPLFVPPKRRRHISTSSESSHRSSDDEDEWVAKDVTKDNSDAGHRSKSKKGKHSKHKKSKSSKSSKKSKKNKKSHR